jgi:hypothetical protein
MFYLDFNIVHGGGKFFGDYFIKQLTTRCLLAIFGREKSPQWWWARRDMIFLFIFDYSIRYCDYFLHLVVFVKQMQILLFLEPRDCCQKKVFLGSLNSTKTNSGWLVETRKTHVR